MWEMEISLGERTQEYNTSVKEGDSKSAQSQHQVMTSRTVLNKPMIERIRGIDSENRNLHRKVKEAIHIKFQRATLNRTGGYNHITC